MPDAKEAQARPGTKQASQDVFDDLFSKGWAEAVEPGGTPSAAPAAPAAKKTEEDDCPDCPKPGELSKDKTPIRVLKHKGKEVPVYSQKQLDDLAQQGFDYTQKRQLDAEEKRKWEADYEARNKALLEQAKRLDAMLATAGDKTAAKPAEGTKPVVPDIPGNMTEEQILKEYGVDPDYVSDYEKGVVLRQYRQDQEMKELKKVSQMVLLDAVFRRVAVTIEEAQKEYPIEDIKLEDGKSATQEQVISIFRDKLSAKENQHRPIQEIARETIKEVHEFQKKVKSEDAPTKSPEDCTDEELKVMYPKLYARMKGNGDSDLPPTMDRAAKAPSRGSSQRAPVDAKHKFSSLAEAIEAGMRDPETLKAISSGG